MKRNYTHISRLLTATVMLLMVSAIVLIGQTPTTFNYQAVLRNSEGFERPGATVSIELDIHQSSETGTVVYSETHSTTTNEFGLVNLEIGSIDPVAFALVDWTAGPYFVEVIVDALSMGVSELLAVPYALYAATANTVIIDAVDDADPDPANELNTGVVLNGTYLEVSDAGGTIVEDLSALVDDADPDPANELNSSLVLNGTDLVITDAGATLTEDLSSLVDDADPDPTNELITGVVLNGTDLEITDAGGTIIEDLSSLVEDADPDPTNELNSSVVLNGNNLEVTDASGTIVEDLSPLVDDADADPTNELQQLSIVGGTIYLTDGGLVVLPVVGPPGAVTNDLISFDGANWVARSALVGNSGAGVAQNNMQPYLGINHVIALQGVFPSRTAADPLLAEIMLFASNFAPRGWALCDGQLLAISSNTALFSLLGTIYGGDGRTTFALPDLRGRTAIHPGTGPGLSTRTLGERGGTETNTMTISQMPVHSHNITYQ